MKRIPTKMEGLDDVLGGGIPDGSIVLVSGAPGTMKTSLTYHILHANALDRVRGLYVSLEQSRASLVDHTEGLGYRLEDTGGNLSILDLGMLRKKLTGPTEQPWMDLFKLYTQGIRKSFDYRLLVLDSLDALEILAKFRPIRVRTGRPGRRTRGTKRSTSRTESSTCDSRARASSGCSASFAS